MEEKGTTTSTSDESPAITKPPGESPTGELSATPTNDDSAAMPTEESR